MNDRSGAAAVALRPATRDDYPALLDIQYRAYRQKEVPLYGENIPPLRETPETVAKEVAEGKQVVVGERNGRIVASMRVKVLENGELYWGRLSVDPDLQGQGIGQQMVRGIENLFPDASGFVLDCGEKSAENRHIYSKMGYVETGESFQVPNGPLVRVMRKNRSQV